MAVLLAAVVALAGCSGGVSLPTATKELAEQVLTPDPEPWDAFKPRRPRGVAGGVAGATVDHGDWDAILKTYVSRDADGAGRFAYGRVSAADRDRLDGYIRRLAAVPVRELSRAEQLAFWINLYNALTVRLVLAHHPVASIRDIDISDKWTTRGPWARKLIELGGEPISLDDIEHRILRPYWKDPRVLYLLSRATLGSPALRPVALSAANLQGELRAAALDFVNSPRAAQVQSGRLVASKLYLWYADDFGGGEEAVVAHLRRYAAADLASALRRVQGITAYVYDWDLDDRTP